MFRILKAKIQRHTRSQFLRFPPSDLFEHIHTDIVNPLGISNEYNYVCTFIDRSIKWIEAIPMKNIISESVAKAFVGNLVSRFGVLLSLTSDCETQFISALFYEILILFESRTQSHN